MGNFNVRTTDDEQWLTPPEIIKALGKFDLDPCSPVNRPWDTATTHYNKLMDGLNHEWKGRVWLNPPYGKETFKWVKKLSEHGDGIALIFARTETKGFHEYVWNKADGIFFFKGRLSFYDVKGNKRNTAPAPSCLVVYGRRNRISINFAVYKKRLTGKFISLNNGGYDNELFKRDYEGSI